MNDSDMVYTGMDDMMGVKLYVGDTITCTYGGADHTVTIWQMDNTEPCVTIGLSWVPIKKLVNIKKIGRKY